MWDGFNKRKFPRVNLRCEVNIETQSHPSALATVTENLGIGGVCVLLDQSLERFTPCHLRLELGENAAPIECDGKIVWIVKTRPTKAHKNRYDTGIEFTNIEPDSAELIRKFIEQFLQKKPSSSPA